MDSPFNPYQEWLGLGFQSSSPNFYQLLGLENSEADAEKIAAAADRAMSRVRSFKPGKHAPLWARLLDDLEAAKNCLLNTERKSQYDADLTAGEPSPTHSPNRPQDTSTDADMQFKSAGASLTSQMYPPGYGAAESQPAAVSVPSPLVPAMPGSISPAAPASPAYRAYDPMAPMMPAAYAAPVQTPAPFVSPSMYSPAAPDPMAPVAMPLAHSLLQYPTATVSHATGVLATYPLLSPAAMAPVAVPLAMKSMNPLAAPIMTGVPVASPVAGFATVPVAQLVAPMDCANAPVAMGVPVTGSLLASAPAQSAATPAVRSSSVRSQLSAERARSSVQTPVILGIGGGLILLTFAIVYATFNGKAKPIDAAMNRPSKSDSAATTSASKPVTESTSRKPPPVVRKPVPPDEMNADEDDPPPRRKPPVPNDLPPTNPTTPPDTPAKPIENPEPKPESKPAEPTPTPIPEKPQEKPPEKPVPEKPESLPTTPTKPTKEQVHSLAEALKSARAALGETDTDEASRLLTSVEDLPKLPEHQAKYERLKQLTHYVREFHFGYNEAVKGLEATASIQIGNTYVGVVELFNGQDKIILKVAGQNRTYRFRDLPVGLAVAIADRWLNKTDGTTFLIKGAFVSAHRKSSEDMVKKAREWWSQAERDLPEIVTKLRPVLDDTYDLEKDLAAEPPTT